MGEGLTVDGARAARIRLDGVRKEFGTKMAVAGLDLTVSAGEVFAFLGPNGAGKTTTLKMVAGLLKPTSGRIHVDGIDVTTDPMAAKRVMGYVPDQPYLYDKLSGRESLSFVADLYDLDPAARRADIPRLVHLFGMETFIDHLTETYSHGMKQRLVLAATLLHRPRVLVVDEPLVGLDPATARLVKRIFRKEADAGAGVFMSTHVLSIAEDVADRVGILQDGKLAALGSVAELREKFGMATLEDLFLDVTSPHEGSAHA